MQDELRGISVFKLGHKIEPQKSIMSSRSFKDATEDIEVLADAVAYHARHAVADLRGMDMAASVISVSVRPSWHGDFFLRGGTKEAILPAPSNDTIKLLKIARDLLSDIYEPGVPYKKAGVNLSHFQPAGQQQGSLFMSEIIDEKPELMAAIDALNDKEGREIVLLGSRLRTKKWQSRLDACSPAYTTRWRDVATVKAE
jgi:DNA polymerase V